MTKKICVYAIAKNENKFIDRWFESVKEADYVCVLDTGSTDGSFEKFLSYGIITKQKVYKNFRFDEARNDSLKLIPADTDICVCVDIDEFFVPGWSKILRTNWQDDTGRARYRYTWNFNPDGSEGVVFMADKIHKFGEYIWTHPVHEILTSTRKNNLKTIDLPTIQLNHRADVTKSRANYLPLLELSVKEDPEDDRNMHYLAREYMFHGKYKLAIKHFLKHLNLKSATWAEERAASYRYIARCYKFLGLEKQEKLKNLKNNAKITEKINKNHKNNYNFNKQIEFLHKSILEYDRSRESMFDLAVCYFEHQKYLESAVWFNQMFKITNRELNYISSPTCWGALPYDYLSMCYYYLSDFKNAIIAAKQAITFGSNERIQKNLQYFLKMYDATHPLSKA